ncbi:MAG: NAD-dependent epimerase/dehydratase family protein [Caldilinea sp. CFX5]|nr:NAD-dependent epimerase/dehydratase family protein [Caldilinea sp. CFX5]
MILVTGAAGKTGRAVIGALAQKGAAVRAYVRRSEQVAAVQAAGATAVAKGDLQDDVALRQAMQGACALYHICPNMHPDEVAIGRRVIAAALAAGIEHFVYHSVLHPQTATMPHHWNKLQVEEALFESRLPFTILQPTAYMQNLLAGWEKIRHEGRYIIPYPAETRIALVDLVDVAAVAATVLTQTEQHQGAIYELVGTAPFTQNAVAAMLADGLDRPVTIEVLTHAAWERNVRAGGLGDYAIDTLIKMFTYYEKFGLIGNPNVLGWLLGRSPTSLATFIHRVTTTPSS